MISRKYYVYINKIYFEIAYLRIIGGKKEKKQNEDIILKINLNFKITIK